MKKPSAFLPPVMSLAALGLVLSYLAVYGFVRQPDEGAAARVWQLLMGGQIPIVLFFAIRWLPEATRQALLVLALQVVAGLAALAPVLLLDL